MSKTTVVAVDFMADNSQNVIEGASQASCYSFDEQIVVVGPESIESQLKYGAKFKEAKDWIGMGEEIGAVRAKPEASINIACRLLKEGSAQALVSSGNSKATVAAAISNLGMLAGIERPAIAVVLPVNKGKVVLTDVGAIVDAKPKWLTQWAILASRYASVSLGKKHPTVGLLNIGEEKLKGNQLAKSCYPLLKDCRAIRFVGNVENIFSGRADVVVCDGFVGNVLLKNLEGGLENFMEGSCREADYSLYGGALLLGVNGVVVIAHGRSSPQAIEKAIGLAVEVVKKGFLADCGKFQQSLFRKEVKVQ